MIVGKFAFLFPGQGSQYIGMGHAFYQSFPEARDLFDQADSLLGFSISSLCFHGPEELLKATENAQPALYISSMAALSAFRAHCNREPDATAGHSVGEYAALTAAGALSFEEGVLLVRKRGELMRDASEQRPGTMAAILGSRLESLQAACREASNPGIVSIANINSDAQIVISGEPEAVRKASEIALVNGAKRAIPLNVSGGFHSPLMVTAGDALYEFLSHAAWRKPVCPVISNIDAKYLEHPDDVVSALTRQVSGTVLWEPSIRRLLDDGFDTFIEIGSGNVLTSLMSRISPESIALSVTDPASMKIAISILQ